MKKLTQKILTASISLMILSSQVLASIPFRDRGVNIDLSLVSMSCSGAGIDFSRIAQFSLDEYTSKDISKMIPTNMAASNDTGHVASQILDQSMQSLFNSESFKTSDIGRSTHKIEKSMQQDVTIGGSAPDSIQHNFKFNMQAAQGKALIDYSGFGHAQISYQVASQELNLEVFHHITGNMKVAYNHINNPSDQRDTVSLKLGF
jgi:hypothetical protein